MPWQSRYSVLDTAAESPPQKTTDQEGEPAKATSHPGGYLLFLPGKRLHITALNVEKKFHDMDMRRCTLVLLIQKFVQSNKK